MLEFRGRQWSMLADKLADAANVAVGALFFGQFLSDREFSLALALAGVAAWVTLLVWAATMAGRGES